MLLSDVCLSCTSGLDENREAYEDQNLHRSSPCHTWHGTTFKVKRSKVKVTRPLYSPPCCHVRQLQRWVWERVGREKLLLRCRLLGCARRFCAHGGEEGRVHIVAAARPPTACWTWVAWWCNAYAVSLGHPLIQWSRVRLHLAAQLLVRNDSDRLFTPWCLCKSSSIIWYRSNSNDAPWLEK